MSEQPWDVLKCIFERNSVVYASVPLTSGQRLLRLTMKSARSAGPDSLDRQQIRRSVFEPNKRHARAFVGRLREIYGNRVVDPSRLPVIAGWTQTHYNHLWEQVIKQYCHTLCFSDGWQYSNGCVLEYVVARGMQKSTVDARGDLIDSDRAIALIEAAAAEMNAAGIDTGAMSHALKQLRTQRYESLNGRVEYALTNDSRRRVYVSLLACAIADRRALLLSTPLSAQEGTQNAKAIAKLRKERAIPINSLFIDRSPVGVKDWRPTLRRRLASDIIRNLVGGVVLLDGWNTDADCLFDLYFALKGSIPIFSTDLERMEYAEALKLVHDAIPSITAADSDVAEHRHVVKALLSLRHVA